MDNKINDSYKNITSPIKKGDGIVYVAVLIIVFAMFFLSTITPKASGNAFVVEVDRIKVFEYNFDTKIATVHNEEYVEKLDELSYKIYSEYGYNNIIILPDSRDCYVFDADCGFSKECQHMSLKNGEIICVPHRLTIKLTGNIVSPRVG